MRHRLPVSLAGQQEVSRSRGIRSGERQRQAVVVCPVQGIFRIILPAQCGVAACQPDECFGSDGDLSVVEAGNVGERRCGFLKLPFLILRLAHQHPCAVQERIELAACQPLLVFIRVGPSGTAYGTALDGMLPDGLLCLLDGSVEVGGTDAGGRRVAYGIEGKQLHVIILVPLLLCCETCLVGFVAVEVDVIAGGQGMIETGAGGVLAGGTSGNEHQEQQDADGVGCFTFQTMPMFFMYSAFSAVKIDKNSFLTCISHK